MEIKLEKSIIDGLSSRAVLAYVAVKMCEGMTVTTAILADQVRAQSSSMREGLSELELAAPGLLHRDKNKWICGESLPGAQVLSMTSSRYQNFVDDLKKYWDYLNKGGSAFDITGRDGSAIQRFLREYSGWTKLDWSMALKNRILSIIEHQHASRTEPFYAWIPKLSNYEASPLDRYNKPVEGVSEKHGKITSIHRGNREAGDEFLSRVRASQEGGSNPGVSGEVRTHREPGRNNGTA